MDGVTRHVTILGCGSSGGVPRLGGLWGACDPGNPKNRRTRCSLLIEQTGPEGKTRVLIDTSPDMRQQLLAADVGDLDAVVFTHAHADHTHGLDDLRMIVFNIRRRLPVYADGPTGQDLLERFSYAFVQPKGSPYPPILELLPLNGGIEIAGAGGPIALTPIPVEHGTIKALGFRFGSTVYMPDVSDIPETSWPMIEGLSLWIVDALRRQPHPTHAHLDKTLDWIARAQPQAAILTNMHNDLDHATVSAETPDHITPAHDGLRIELSV